MIAVIWSGTLEFASRREFDALSRNVNTMQANHELSWDRIEALALQTAAHDVALAQLEADLEQLADEVEKAVAETQAAVAETQGAVAEVQSAVDETQAAVAELSDELATTTVLLNERLDTLDGRMGSVEDGLDGLTASLMELNEAFSAVEDRVTRFDAFFASLRDLLIDLKGPGGSESE